MKRYVYIAMILAGTTVAVLFIYTKILAGKTKSNESDRLKLEDSIIIRDITMESDVPMSDDEHDDMGQIIFDDSFGDAIIDYDELKEKGIHKYDEDHGGKAIEGLKSNDKRWHLIRYEIKKNDNLWDIARRYGVSHDTLIDINRITNPDMLLPGKFIDIPTKRGVYYTVKKGDTLSEISKIYKVKSNKIIAHNNIRGSIIREGEKIFIPDASYRKSEKHRSSTGRKSTSLIAKKFNFKWPLRGRITSGFGNRKDPFSGKRSFHCGIDISANVGSPIKAAAKGRVIFSGWKPGYGKVVVLRHDNGYITVYAHNSRNIVEVGSVIDRGGIVAYSGMTGAVTGAHLHFEIRKYVSPLNPMRFLR